jgi:NAD(P)-dependent dehydrogenase (short-subunit alcohol dehydrogenase family)
MKPVCLVIGAGAGIGGNVGKRFAQEGYHAVLCRRTDEEGLRKLVGDRSLKDTSYKAFELGWRLATFALFRVASAVCPLMEERGRGTILVTSATAAVRGNGGQHSHAAAMGGRRMLCQTLNAEFSPKGIHVAHILIDGAVDAPDTLGKMLGSERFQQLREARGLDHDGLLLPSKIADTYLHLAQQHRSTWTHEIDLRSFSDRPWWNH